MCAPVARPALRLTTGVRMRVAVAIMSSGRATGAGPVENPPPSFAKTVTILR